MNKHFPFSPHAGISFVCWPAAAQFAHSFITCYSHFKPTLWNEHVLYRHSPLGLSSTRVVINFFSVFLPITTWSWADNFMHPPTSPCVETEAMSKFCPLLWICYEVLSSSFTTENLHPFLGYFDLFSLVIRSQEDLLRWYYAYILSQAQVVICCPIDILSAEVQKQKITVILPGWQGQITFFHKLSHHLLPGFTLCLLASQMKKEDTDVSSNCNLNG